MFCCIDVREAAKKVLFLVACLLREGVRALPLGKRYFFDALFKLF